MCGRRMLIQVEHWSTRAQQFSLRGLNKAKGE